MLKMTKEQMDILKEAKDLQYGDIIIVNALAGCAKTTTLKKIAEENIDKKFLYLAFNRKIVDEAKATFPNNTTVFTLHSLARKYTEKKELTFLNIDTISHILNMNISNKNQYFKTFNALKAYQSFCKSAFSIYELDDLKDEILKNMKNDFEKKLDNKNMDFIIDQRVGAVDRIEYIHESILNSNFTTFDTYLKYFVDTIENIDLNYEYIVLDESQDVSKLLSKFIISLVKSQRYKIIIVGDNSQKIYGFLGNINLALNISTEYKEKTFSKELTQSFRFKKSSEMETLSNYILKFRDEKITGANINIPKKSDKDRIAFISRSTFPLLAMAIYQIEKKESYHLYGGITNFNIPELIDIYNLYNHTQLLKKYLTNSYTGNIKEKISLLSRKKDKIPFPNIKTNSLKAFSSFIELQDFVTSRAIFDMENSINIVYFIISKQKDLENINGNLYHNIVEVFFSLIERFSDINSRNIISTIHKAKGLEFEEVTILKSLYMNFDIDTEKIIRVSSGNGHIIGLEKLDINVSYQNKIILSELIINIKASDIREEYNILYVAITRAIRDIKISNANYIETLKFLEFLNENMDEVNNIYNNKESELTFEIAKVKSSSKKSKDFKGIIYEGSFISIKTIYKFLEEIY